jgi:predicted nuclease of predicted toxin-antitoxin system
MKLLIDMNLSPFWENFFAASHIEAVHWSAIGEADAPDSIILDYAATHGFAVFTHDLDFGFLLAAAHADKPSVIQIRMDDLFPDASATPVISALQNLSAEIEQGALITISPHKTRIHILPFTLHDT